MGKYGSGLRIADACRMECEEVTAILKGYEVSEGHIARIVAIIRGAYCMFEESCRSGRAFDLAVRDAVRARKYEKIIKNSLHILMDMPADRSDESDEDCTDGDEDGLDFCEECKAAGNDWYRDDEGELVNACEECGLPRNGEQNATD